MFYAREAKYVSFAVAAGVRVWVSRMRRYAAKDTDGHTRDYM